MAATHVAPDTAKGCDKRRWRCRFPVPFTGVATRDRHEIAGYPAYGLSTLAWRLALRERPLKRAITL